MLGYLIVLVLSGLLIGALGRLAIPGPNPMGFLMTILVGIGGSLLGGFVSRLVGIPQEWSFVVAVLCAALIVYLVSGSVGRRSAFGGRRGMF